MLSARLRGRRHRGRCVRLCGRRRSHNDAQSHKMAVQAEMVPEPMDV